MSMRGGRAYRQNKLFKKMILERDNYTCQNCGCKVGDWCPKHASPVKQMDCAHIVAWNHSPESTTPKNLRALCHPCNQLERRISIERANRTRAMYEAEIIAWAHSEPKRITEPQARYA